MEARETDKLFREKLKNLESAPKKESWNKLESMMDKKEAVVWYTRWKVAAIGLLLILSGVIWVVWNQSNEALHIELAESVVESSETDQTNNTLVPEIVQDVSEESPRNVEQQNSVDATPIQEKKQIRTVRKEKPEPKQKVLNPVEENKPIVIEKEESLLAEADINVEEAIEPEEVHEVQETKARKRMPIRITYKRGNSKVREDDFIARQKTDTTSGKLKEFFAQTRDFQPGDLWADIREAKHNLFQKKENSKRNNVKNLNK